MENSARNIFKRSLYSFTIVYCLFSPFAVWSAPKLPPARLEGQAVEDLPAPYNLRAVVLNRSVTLNWAWDPPDPGPLFQNFGYEVMRGTAPVGIVGETAFSEFDLAPGVYSYSVRVKGGAREMGRKIAHMSAWSEPAQADIILTCAGPPVIRLKVVPTKKVYGDIPALRLHVTGDVKVPDGCRVSRAMFHIDSGVSSERSGPLALDAQGRFDEFIDAMGAEEERITGGATFKVYVTAKDEVGDAASPFFTIDLTRRDPYAPQ
ncbi:MAG: hypothetical protein A2992_03635 [Elusimicrobia bacterium RIFCSPLOWO2_01_FULL_59_12]|nr:MAG: hypothetical protein A2992_03635 [Elusimicrobia bacterium RIFCSPLOWO2_01_FULL_59_12]